MARENAIRLSRYFLILKKKLKTEQIFSRLNLAILQKTL